MRIAEVKVLRQAFYRWWQPEFCGENPATDIEQRLFDDLHRRRVQIPILMTVMAASIACIAARTVPVFWPLLWFVLVAGLQIYRAQRIAALAKDKTKTSSERLRESVILFLFASSAFALAAFFFPFSVEPFRYILSIAVIGVIAGTLATAKGYPPIFFAFAVPNMLAICIGWLISMPTQLPYWVHVVVAALLLVLFGYLLILSRVTYRTFATSEHTNAKLLQELEKMQRINEAKSKVFASASHDLRQPLQSISLLSHRLSDRNIADEERKNVAATIGTCVDLLSEELDMLLDISGLESAMTSTNPELVDVCSMIESVVQLYTLVAIAKDVVITVERVRSPVVKVDRVLLSRLIRNLIDNALKYTHNGTVTITINRKGELAVIEFADSGVGISDQDQVHIFDEFYQTGNPERDRSKGLGLGLSVVKRILPLIGGQLSVESELNVGSIFSLKIPASDEPVAVPPRQSLNVTALGEPVDTSEILRGKRVLLIEDHELVQKATTDLLEANGAEVAVAVDWNGVQRLLELASPDLLISDLRLPSETGLEIANRIRNKISDLPVLLISGDLSSDLASCAKEEGYRVLGKPIRLTTLLNEIGLLFN